MEINLTNLTAATKQNDDATITQTLCLLKDEYRLYLCDALLQYFIDGTKEEFGSLVMEGIFNHVLRKLAEQNANTTDAIAIIEKAKAYVSPAENN